MARKAKERTDSDIDFMTQAEVAVLLDCHVITLANWRSRGVGPPWLKIGHKVKYNRSSVESWIRQQEVETE